MTARLFAPGFFLIGATLLVNTHLSSAQHCAECEKVKAPATPATQPAVLGAGAVTEKTAAQTQKAAPRLGVPDFTLMDQNGQAVTLSSFAGKVIVLEWINPQCPYVVRHYNNKTMQTLVDKYRDQGVVWLAINSTSTADAGTNRAWADKHNLTYPVLNDNTGKVGKDYGAKTTPHMFIIDASGKLVYKGAIDNDPQGEKSDKANYVDQTLQKIVKGQSLDLQETKPYGCSVKYAKATVEAR